MARIVVIVSLLVLAACDVGELPGLSGDGGVTGDSGNGCAPIAAAADILAGHHPEGHQSRTIGCMSAAGCHNAAQAPAGPVFSYGGLLFKGDKTTPLGGGTIVVKLGAAEKRAVSSANGEFWLTAEQIGPPTNEMQGKTDASGCPNVQPMATPLVAGSGDCGKGGCHAPVGGIGVVFLNP
jgi:hypothetical protein